MKTKNTILTTLSLVLVLALSACSSNTLSYDTFVIDLSDSAAGAGYQVEKELCKTEKQVDLTVPQTATLTINDKTIIGTYSHSEKTFPDTFYTHLYQEEDTSCEFALDDSGKITWLSMPTKDLKTENAKELTKEACLTIAKDFILNTISANVNLDEYTVNEVAGSSDSYSFEFRKYINDYATVDKASVHVLKNGTIWLYKSTMFGRISADSTPKLNQSKIIRAVEKKLDTIYRDAKESGASAAYEKAEYYFTLLEDGKPAVYCDATIRLRYVGGMSCGEMVRLIIT